MKVYVLAACSNEENRKSEVFTTKEKAVAKMKAYCKEAEEKYMSAIFSVEVFDESAEIIYLDDTYEVYEVFEVEVQ